MVVLAPVGEGDANNAFKTPARVSSWLGRPSLMRGSYFFTFFLCCTITLRMYSHEYRRKTSVGEMLESGARESL